MSSKRTVLITGCSDGGLGSELALAFHKAGWRVFASARNPSKLKAVEAAGIETIQLDVTSDESVASSVARVKELTGGSLDALLNNAGGGYSLPLMDVDIDKAKAQFDLNVFSIIRVTQSFLPLLLNSTRGALVVNNTSVAALLGVGLPFHGTYNASKAAAMSLTETMRLELGPFGIRVIDLVTGALKSAFFDNAVPTTLPPDSIYNVSKESVERSMSGVDLVGIGGDPREWARLVVRDLSKPNPPHWIARGTSSTQARIASLFPVGTFDGMIKSKAGLDVLERKVKEKGGPSKIKAL